MALTKAQLEKRKQQLAENKKNEEQMYKNLLGISENHDNVKPVSDSSISDNAATSTSNTEDVISEKIPDTTSSSTKNVSKSKTSKSNPNTRYSGTQSKKYLLKTYPELFDDLTAISLAKSIESGHAISVSNLIHTILIDYIDKYFNEKGES